MSASTETLPGLAELSVRQAQEAICIVPAEELDGRFVLASDAVASLREELHQFFRFLKEKGQLLTELLSATARDQAVRQLSQNMLDSAYKTPSRSWMVGLPTGRQLVVVPSSLLDAIGPECVCQVAHEKAISEARSASQPFNSQAFMHYQASSPRDSRF